MCEPVINSRMPFILDGYQWFTGSEFKVWKFSDSKQSSKQKISLPIHSMHFTFSLSAATTVWRWSPGDESSQPDSQEYLSISMGPVGGQRKDANLFEKSNQFACYSANRISELLRKFLWEKICESALWPTASETADHTGNGILGNQI